jgi:hypothetical protein
MPLYSTSIVAVDFPHVSGSDPVDERQSDAVGAVDHLFLSSPKSLGAPDCKDTVISMCLPFTRFYNVAHTVFRIFSPTLARRGENALGPKPIT